MNEQGFSLFLVLTTLTLFSMLMLHFLALYQNEKQFLELEQDQFRMEQLIYNGIVEAVAHLEEDAPLIQGELSIAEGLVYYEIEGDSIIKKITLEINTVKERSKRVIFNYNIMTKSIDGWREGNI